MSALWPTSFRMGAGVHRVCISAGSGTCVGQASFEPLPPRTPDDDLRGASERDDVEDR